MQVLPCLEERGMWSAEHEGLEGWVSSHQEGPLGTLSTWGGKFPPSAKLPVRRVSAARSTAKLLNFKVDQV